MTISDPDQTPLDPDTGAPQEPSIDDPDTGDQSVGGAVPDEDGTDDLPGEDALDGAADGDVLADPDIALGETPRGTQDLP